MVLPFRAPVRNSEEWWETWHHHSRTNRWQRSVPHTSMGMSCEQNLDMSKSITGYFSVHSLAKWLHRIPHLQKCPSTLVISLCHNRKRLSQLWTSQSRNSLSANEGSNGHVSQWSPRLHHNAPRQVVKQRFPLLHLETDWAILTKCCEEDVDFFGHFITSRTSLLGRSP